MRWQARLAAEYRPLLTTEFVLMEIGDGLAALRFRAQAAQVILTLRSTPLVEVVPASARLVEEAFTLFSARSDKDWGMTDCSSFSGYAGARIVRRVDDGRPFPTSWLSRLVIRI